jgi:hypothetical protein
MSLQQLSQDLYNNNLSDEEKHASFVAFKNYFDKLCTTVLGTTTYTDDQLAQHIFKQRWPDKQEEMIYKKHLFAAKNTLNRYNIIVNAANFSQYNFVLRMFAFDLYGIVRHGEKKYRNTELNFNIGTRPDQDAREIFDVSEGILHIGTINPAQANFREVIPVSIFLLRQTIEVYGKRALGFYSITDQDGTRIRNVSTQVSWEFIKKETLKTNSRIRLQAHIDTIKRVEEWTNGYVHTGLIPEIFLIENAVHFVKALIYPMNNIKNYKGTVRFYGITQIQQYNSVKDDFEKFVNTSKNLNLFQRIRGHIYIFFKIKKKPKKIVVNWMDIDSVDSTILSL